MQIEDFLFGGRDPFPVSRNYADYRSFGKAVRHGDSIVYVCREADSHGYSSSRAGTLLILVIGQSGEKKRFSRIVKSSGDDLIDPSIISFGDELLIVSSNRLDSSETVEDTFIYSSTDGGETWSEKAVIETPSGFDFIKAYNIYALPGGDLLIFGYLRPTSDPDHRIVRVWRSTDGGETWAVNGNDIDSTTVDFIAEPAVAILSATEWVVVCRTIITSFDAYPAQFSTHDAGQSWCYDGDVDHLGMGIVSPFISQIEGSSYLWFADRENGRIGFCPAKSSELPGSPAAWSDPVFVAGQQASAPLDFGYPCAVQTGRGTLVFYYDTAPGFLRGGIQVVPVAGQRIEESDALMDIDFKSERDVELSGSVISKIRNVIVDLSASPATPPNWSFAGVEIANNTQMQCPVDFTNAKEVTFIVVASNINVAATILLDHYTIQSSSEGLQLKFDPQSNFVRFRGKPTAGNYAEAKITGINYSGEKVAVAGTFKSGELSVFYEDGSGLRMDSASCDTGDYSVSLRGVGIGYAPGTVNTLVIERAIIFPRQLTPFEINILLQTLL